MTVNQPRTFLPVVDDDPGHDSPASPDVERPIQSRGAASRRHGLGRASRRLVVFAFGLVQLVILLEVLLLLIDARPSAPLVAAINVASGRLVGPFEGILRSDVVRASGSTIDLAAIVAFIGWTILEAVVLGVIGIFDRDR